MRKINLFLVFVLVLTFNFSEWIPLGQLSTFNRIFAAEQGLLFSDDFGKGAGKWEELSGAWEAQKGEYIGTGDGESTSGDEGWKDYVYEVRLKAEEPGEQSWNVGIVTFRFMDKDNRYFVLLHTSKLLELGKRQDGQHKPALKTVQNVADPKQWNTIRIEAKKDNIKVYVNGELKIDYTDPEPMLEGKIGFWINGATTVAKFDDVKVWEYGKAPGVGQGFSPAKVEAKKEEPKKEEPKKEEPKKEVIKTSGGVEDSIIVDLTVDSDLTNKYIRDGWWQAEKDARWTGRDKKDAQVVFPVEEGKVYTALVNITSYPFRYLENKGEVGILVEGKSMKTINFESAEGLVEVSIPEEITKGKKEVVLSIRSVLFCPKDLSMSSDNRTLGVKVKDVQILANPKPVKKTSPTGRKSIAILKDNLPSVSSPDSIAKLLKDNGFSVELLKFDDLANPQVFNKENYNLVILPCGPYFPASAKNNFLQFLRRGGDFISIGGYTFDSLLYPSGGKWLAYQKLKEEFDRALASVKPTNVIFDFENEDLSGWNRTSGDMNIPTTYEVVKEGPGGRKAMRVDIPEFAGSGWDTLYSLQVSNAFPEGATLTSFWAKGGPNTKNLLVEWNEKDGSRWIATIDLTTSWKRYNLSPAEFKYWKDSPTKDRGSGKDSFNPQNASKLCFGIASSHGKYDKGAHSYWVAEVGAASSSGLKELPREVFINGRYGKPANYGGLEMESERICIFDPSYSLERVKYAKANSEQPFIDKNLKINGDFKGYTAIGLTGDVWGTSAKDRSRYVPLIMGYDVYGRSRGAIAGMTINYRSIYKGSVWVYFGVDNTDLFSSSYPEMNKTLVDIMKSLESKIYINELRSDTSCYYPGEEVNVKCNVANFTENSANNKIKFQILSCENEKVVFENIQDVLLEPGEIKKLGWSWKPAEFTTDIYRLRAYLMKGDNIMDVMENGFVAWNDKIAKTNLPLTYKDNYLCIKGKPQFLLGVQGFWYSGSLHARSPLTIAKDMEMMRDYGIRFTRYFTRDEDQRFYDVIAYLSQKYGVVLFYEGISSPDFSPAGHKKGLERAKKIAERYKGIPGITIDIRNEPSCAISNSPDQKKLFNEFLKNKYGSRVPWDDKPVGDIDIKPLSNNWGELRNFDTDLFVLQYMRKWESENSKVFHDVDPGWLVSVGYLPGGSWGPTIHDAVYCNENLDFTNRHFYGSMEVFPAEFKMIDMRYDGKAPSIGEFGSAEHPTFFLTGYFDTKENQIKRYELVSHYTLGLGGIFASNWHWRNPIENVFPFGLSNPDWIAKDVLKVYRNQGMLFSSFKPKYQPPSLYYLLPDNHRISYIFLRTVLYNGLDELMNCHLDFGVIDEHNVDKLLSEAKSASGGPKAIVYPLPFMPDDKVYGKLRDFVKAGGSLYFSGDISYDPATFDRSKESRLEELAGVKFIEENFKGIMKTTQAKKKITPVKSEISGLGEYEGYPCIRVKPTSAKVLSKDEDGNPVTVLNEIGKGKVLFTTDISEVTPEQLSASGIYSTFIKLAGVNINKLAPSDPKVHLFRLPTTEGGTIFVLYNRNKEKNFQGSVQDMPFPVTLNLNAYSPGLIHIDSQGNLLGIEASGEVKQKDSSIIKTTTHLIAYTLDSKAITQSKEIVLLPYGLGSITLKTDASWQELVAEVGDVDGMKWRSLETLKPQISGGTVKIDVNEDRALSIIILREKSNECSAKILN